MCVCVCGPGRDGMVRSPLTLSSAVFSRFVQSEGGCGCEHSVMTSCSRSTALLNSLLCCSIAILARLSASCAVSSAVFAASCALTAFATAAFASWIVVLKALLAFSSTSSAASSCAFAAAIFSLHSARTDRLRERAGHALSLSLSLSLSHTHTHTHTHTQSAHAGRPARARQ